MKTKICASVLLVVMIIFLAGCEAPKCYPPNKIIDNKCCIDDDSNGVCDIEETHQEEAAQETVQEQPAVQEEVQQPEVAEEEAVAEETPEAAGLEPGKYDIRIGEPKKYLEINELKSYRTSRDKGMLDEMTFTVRNIGTQTLNPVVELFFDGSGMNYIDEERVPEYDVRVGKEYTLDAIKPGEKRVIKKSLGIRFQGIDNKKTLTLTIYDRFTAPRKDLEVLKKEFVPQDLFKTMDIYTYGMPDE